MREDSVVQIKRFSEVNLSDPFFDTLKSAYVEFDNWFQRKAQESAYVVYDDSGGIQGFLYIKEEHGPIRDIQPPLNAARVLKVGTFKVNPHNTKLGERFVKKIFDCALEWKVTHLYVTVFSEHEGLITLLERYGFKRYGTKDSANGREDVFIKDFISLTGDIEFDYPIINAARNKWLLSVKPEYHSRLFPDSILRTEDSKIINDISHTNSIHKIYIGRARDIPSMRQGDVLVIYRPAEEHLRKGYHSVATSLCVVEEVRPRNLFPSEQNFVDYAAGYSVFTEQELREWFKKPLYAIRMTYNVALPKRPNLVALIQQAGLSPTEYWGLRQLTNQQFTAILTLGQVYEGVVIH